MYKIERNSSSINFVFNGKIDSFEAKIIEDQLKIDLENIKEPIVFNLREVTFISSAFLRLCLYTSIKIGIDNFKLINLAPAVKNVFKLTGFEKSFIIE